MFVGGALLAAAAWAGCSESQCDKLEAVEWTQLSRYCAAGGAGTAFCFCWENDSVLGGWTAGSCTNGVDEDGDGLTDCEDSDCMPAEACQCGNGADDDNDGLTDCDDPECAYSNACCHVRERADACCRDGRDNDLDGLTDCEEDPDCGGSCCEDGMDNDGDGLTDCDDPECGGRPPCCTAQDSEACACEDGQDNDGDGMTDCQDDDCALETACWSPRNSRFSERIGYCVDRLDAMDEACEEPFAADQLQDLDPGLIGYMAQTGLFGRYRVTDTVRLTYDVVSGDLTEEVSLDTPLVQGPDASGNSVSLEWIVFEPTGWFRSNISDGVWSVVQTAGKIRSTILVAFLTDDCLADRWSCDTSRPTSYRPDSAGGLMLYTWDEVPQGSVMYLGQWTQEADTLVFEGIRLEH